MPSAKTLYIGPCIPLSVVEAYVFRPQQRHGYVSPTVKRARVLTHPLTCIDISQGAKTLETYKVILEFGQQDAVMVLAKHASICLKAKTSAPTSAPPTSL